jgi:hypothetical protein
MPERHYPRFERRLWRDLLWPIPIVSMPERHYPRFEPLWKINSSQPRRRFNARTALSPVRTYTASAAELRAAEIRVSMPERHYPRFEPSISLFYLIAPNLSRILRKWLILTIFCIIILLSDLIAPFQFAPNLCSFWHFERLGAEVVALSCLLFQTIQWSGVCTKRGPRSGDFARAVGTCRVACCRRMKASEGVGQRRRRVEERIFCDSRYLTTVRRATVTPRSSSNCTIC